MTPALEHDAESRGLPAARPAPAAAAAPGQGWLGLAVGESSVPGRWVVDSVAAVGPAAAAGILPGDEVRGINGQPLRSADDVSQALTSISPGQVVGLAIARGEQVRDVQLAAAARPPVAAAATPAFAAAPPLAPAAAAVASAAPPSPPAATANPLPPAAPVAAAPSPFIPAPVAPPEVDRPQPTAVPARSSVAAAAAPTGSSAAGRTALGVRTVPIDAELQSRFHLPAASGAYVIGVVQDLPASKAGVPPGSVIVSLNDRPVRSPAELTQLVTSGPVGRPVTLEYVLPGGSSQRADVVLQTLERPLEEALVGPAQPVATGVPTLEPGPAATIARRPVVTDTGAAAAIRDEIRWLQSRLATLERRLDALPRESAGADTATRSSSQRLPSPDPAVPAGSQPGL
ncbi:MAG: hypothetical protein RLZZ440_176 [Planctomycetota bacterium]